MHTRLDTTASKRARPLIAASHPAVVAGSPRRECRPWTASGDSTQRAAWLPEQTANVVRSGRSQSETHPADAAQQGQIPVPKKGDVMGFLEKVATTPDPERDEPPERERRV